MLLSLAHSNTFQELNITLTRENFSVNQINFNQFIDRENDPTIGVIYRLKTNKLTLCRDPLLPPIYGGEGSSVRCHFAKDTVVERNKIFAFHGISKSEFGEIMSWLMESGIWSMYMGYTVYLEHVEAHKWQRNVEHEERQPLPFNMACPQIVSIFMGWAILLGFGTIGILIEILYRGNIQVLCNVLVSWRICFRYMVSLIF